MESQGTPNSHNNLKKRRRKLEVSYFLIPKLNYKGTVISVPVLAKGHIYLIDILYLIIQYQKVLGI